MPLLRPPVGQTDAPQQYKQRSRKGKSAWRKNVDVSQIEHGLEELNKEIIQGGVIKEKSDSELFALDVAGDLSIKHRLPNEARKALKADEIIAQRSAVKAVSIRKRGGDHLDDGVVTPKRRRTNFVSHSDVIRLRKIADGKHDPVSIVHDAQYDVWAAPVEDREATEKKALPELPQKVQAKPPPTLRRAPISLAANGKPVPAVQKPTGGYSYNPAYYDYQARLAQETAKVVESERRRLEQEEAASAREEAIARSAAEAEAAEARAELSEWDDDSAWEGFESGVEGEATAPTKRPQRKTRVQRNKIQRRKEEERRLKHAAAIKAKEAQAAQAKQIAHAIVQSEQSRALARAQETSTDIEGDDAVLRRRQLGRLALGERDLELVLPDELEESLRLLRPEGNLLKDRYRSLLVRGKLESRRHLPFKKQPKMKSTEKWTFKDFTLF